MSRPATLSIRKLPSGKWAFRLPPNMSPTGKQCQRSFATQQEAKLVRAATLEKYRIYGFEGHSLSPRLAEEATQAANILKPFGISLVESARQSEAIAKQRAASVSFTELWERFEASRKQKSPEHRKTLKALGRYFIEVFGKTPVCDIGHEHLRNVLEAKYKTPHYFNLALRGISTSFSFAAKEGWVRESPCRRIDKKDIPRASVELLSLAQCRNLFGACKDYRRQKNLPAYLRVNASRAVPAFALMLFAGVRPAETARLEWSDIDMLEGTVKVSNVKAKTDRSRYFQMSSTLRAWLETAPESERRGHVCLLNWRGICKAVRKAVGIGHLHDPFRKTFATMHLAAYNDVNATRAIMGHELGDVLFAHYRGLATRKEAEAFWRIMPPRG